MRCLVRLPTRGHRITLLMAAACTLAASSHAGAPGAAPPVVAPSSSTSTPTAGFPAAQTPPTQDPVQPAGPPEVTDIGEAREAFRLGLGLSRAGQWTDALAAFQRSAHLKPHPVTTYNIGYCERSLGLYASAYGSFLLALDSGREANGEHLPEEFETEARAYVAEAERRVAHAQVILGAPDLSIRVDGRPVVAVHPAANRSFYIVSVEGTPDRTSLPPAFDLWLDPGRHLFAASRPGGPEIVQSYAVSAGTSIEVRFGAAPTPVGTSAPKDATDAREERGIAAGPNRTLALSVLGVGAAGLIASAVFAGLALSDKSDLDGTNCPGNVCPPPYHSQEEEMKRFASFATVGLVVGVVGAGAGAYLWFTAKPPRRGSDHGVTIEPRIGLGTAGVAGRF